MISSDIMIQILHRDGKNKMHCYTLSSKGQITIPSKIREQFHLKAGDRIAINKSITSLKGLLSKPKKPLAVKK